MKVTPPGFRRVLLFGEDGRAIDFQEDYKLVRCSMSECENRCVNERRLIKIEEDLKDLREKNSKDHKEFYNRIEDNEKAMVESTSDRKHINEKLDKIDGNVEALMQTPAKR